MTSNNGPAPWRSLFLSHLDKMETPEFVLSTVHRADSSESSSKSPPPPDPSSAATAPPAPVPYIPRSRYCVYRGMWTELPANKHNTAERNPGGIFESEMPTFTTDVRMEKVGELFGSSAGHAETQEQVQGSGGGGPLEAVWWVKETMTQWRIKGEGYLIASSDIERADGDGGKDSSGVRTVKSEVGRRMRRIKNESGEGKEKEWSWAREVRGHFGNMSPGLRGSFKAPPPGRPITEPYDTDNLKMGTKVEDLDDPLARKHFRVGIIIPSTVEKLDVTDPAKARRWLYTYVEDDNGRRSDKRGVGAGAGSWTVEERWP